jgi:hypothetical protein
MPCLPDDFPCTVHGPDDEIFQSECFRRDSRVDLGKKIRLGMKKRYVAEMKIHFGKI